MHYFTYYCLSNPNAQAATNRFEYYSNSDVTKGSDITGLDDPLENMKKLFKFAGYTHALQIDTGLEENREEFDRSAKDVADSLELEPVRAEPGMTDLGPSRDVYIRSKADLDAAALDAERSREGWPRDPPGPIRFQTLPHMVWAA